jgi:2',3'-cyclic-nucleotide 2'-phosphodiesterase/3'-nucleotidase/5'-nucleotidase
VSADGKFAYVTLQENNAVAVVKIRNRQITEILPLGYKDWSAGDNKLDASDSDGPIVDEEATGAIHIKNWNVFGMYQPDAIANFQIGHKTYFVTVNEGDVRQWGEFDEEARVKDLDLDAAAFPDEATLKLAENLGRLKVTNTLGDTDGDGDYDKLYAFGARSFTIFDTEGNVVFDSAGLLEQITADLVPELFNSEGTAEGFDTRSDDKGPEPEALTIGQIDGRTYAFIGLERTGGIMIFDITDPKAPAFVQYVRNAADIGPEGLTFVPASDSPTGQALLAVANEISGTTTLYQVTKVL